MGTKWKDNMEGSRPGYPTLIHSTNLDAEQ